MTPGESYRLKAAEILAKSRSEPDPLLRAELEQLARSYLRLAEQADKNSDEVYERPLGAQPAQQQQQPQPKADGDA